MKLFVVMLLVSGSCYAALDATVTEDEKTGEYVRVLNETDSGKTYIYSASSSDAKNSVWSGTGEPPLSLGQALKIALEHINKLTGSNAQFKPHGVELRKFADNRVANNSWYYFITLIPYPYGHKEYAQNRKDLVVIFSGKIIDPIVR